MGVGVVLIGAGVGLETAEGLEMISEAGRGGSDRPTLLTWPVWALAGREEVVGKADLL